MIVEDDDVTEVVGGVVVSVCGDELIVTELVVDELLREVVSEDVIDIVVESVMAGKTVLVVELVDVSAEVLDAIVLDIVEVEENGVVVLDDS